MKIVLRYQTSHSKIIDYNPGVSSIPTRSVDGDEKFIGALVPKEVMDNKSYISRLALSMHSEYGIKDIEVI